MKQVLIVWLGIIIHLFCNGQETDYIRQSLQQLKSSGIDTCIVFFECDVDRSEFVVTDTCIFRNPKYLMWKENNQILIIKVADCFDTTGATYIAMKSKQVPTTNVKAYSLIENFITEILEEEIYPTILKYKIKGKDAYIPLGRPSHPCYFTIDIHTKDRVYKKGFFDYYLYDGIIRHDDGSTRHKWESVNYEYNISTFIYRLSLLLSAMIEDLEKRKAFKY